MAFRGFGWSDQRFNAGCSGIRRPSNAGSPQVGDDAYFEEEDNHITGFGSIPPSSTGFGFSDFAPPMPKCPSAARNCSGINAASNGEVDPLDAYMDQVNAEVANACGSRAVSNGTGALAVQKLAPWEYNRNDDDPAASYLESYSSQGPSFWTGEGDEAEANGDRRSKAIEPMPAIDHSSIRYNPVRNDFYTQHEEIAQLDDEQVVELRRELGISATGSNAARPIASFGHLAPSLGRELMESIRRHGYSQPTPIQAQAIPVALSGRDMIGIAETGSGKTAAYLLPMLVHCIDQQALQKGEGPIGVVLCPTRELAVQIEQEAVKFNRQLGMRSVVLAGGLSKLEQFKEMKRGCEIAICNPGRLIDVVAMKGCTMKRVTFVVLDEADRMFHMGFEYQVRSIMQNVRPSRQVLLFSATFPPKIEKLARDIIHSPIRVTIGKVGQAATNVNQFVEVLKNDEEKWTWLSKRVMNMLAKGQVLVFVKSIASAEELAQNFMDFLELKSEFLHGDLDQASRLQILKAFKKRAFELLIATDVAARGLDIPSIKTVVSYDVARDLETHTHRIGRTGRAGATGDAHTLLTRDTDDGKKMAALLADSLEAKGQEPSGDHMELALKYAPYRSAKLAGKKFENKRKIAAGPAVKSSYGLGFDGTAQAKETSKELEQRLNAEADKLAKVNRNIMAKAGSGRGMAAACSLQVAGFVSAATIEEPIQIPKPAIEGDSDEDLFAPGVTSAFGKAPPAAKPAGPTAAQIAMAIAWQKQQEIRQREAQQEAALREAQQGADNGEFKRGKIELAETPRPGDFHPREHAQNREEEQKRIQQQTLAADRWLDQVAMLDPKMAASWVPSDGRATRSGFTDSFQPPRNNRGRSSSRRRCSRSRGRKDSRGRREASRGRDRRKSRSRSRGRRRSTSKSRSKRSRSRSRSRGRRSRSRSKGKRKK